MTPLRQRMLEDMQMRNLSPHTQNAYIRAVARFAQHFRQSPDHLDRGHVRGYLLHLVRAGASWSLYNQVRCDRRAQRLPYARGSCVKPRGHRSFG
jgi:hypothetical protein